MNKYLDPKKYIDFTIRKIKSWTSNLENKGERVDIFNNGNIQLLTQNDKCHLARYEFVASYIPEGSIVGDFACGTGYGTIMLAKKAMSVTGVDIDATVISHIAKRYKSFSNITFVEKNLLNIDYKDVFTHIVSFETIEHFSEEDILTLLTIYKRALASGGKVIFSTPYMQEKSNQAVKMGFHKTFNISEEKIQLWLQKTGFTIEKFYYQKYSTHSLYPHLFKKDFIVCIAVKN